MYNDKLSYANVFRIPLLVALGGEGEGNRIGMLHEPSLYWSVHSASCVVADFMTTLFLKFPCPHYAAHCFNKLKGTVRYAALCIALLAVLQTSTLITYTNKEGKQLKDRGAQTQRSTFI
jgi:hypothetical protein